MVHKPWKETFARHPNKIRFFKEVNKYTARRLRPGMKMLDIASNDFRYAPLFRDVEYVGADLEESLVAKGRRIYPDGKHLPVCCNASRLPFAGNAFDLVVSTHTLVHISKKRDVHSAVEEFVRVLKPDGDLIMSIPDRPAKLKIMNEVIAGQFESITHVRYRRSLVDWWEENIVLPSLRGRHPWILGMMLSIIAPVIYVADVFGPTTRTLFICEKRKAA